MNNAAGSGHATLAERIAEALSGQIVRGELAPGAALRQDHVAEQFQASHVPVREAFQRLEALGLLQALPRRGMRVTSLGPAVIKENVEMRSSLELLALRHSVPRFTAAHIAQLEQAQALCSQAASLAQWDAANRRFHDILSSECGMPRLLAVLRQLQLTNSRYLFSMAQSGTKPGTGQAGAIKRGWQPRSDHDHQLIIDALKDKKTDRALQLLALHIGTMERVGFRSG